MHTWSPLMLGNILSSGTSTASMTIWPVILARRENFPSIFGVDNPFMPFSKINPRIAFWCTSDLAHTIKTSATGELVILKSPRSHNLHIILKHVHIIARRKTAVDNCHLTWPKVSETSTCTGISEIGGTPYVNYRNNMQFQFPIMN